LENGRATGIVGHVTDARAVTSHHVRIRAKVVVVAAGAINTPAILRRSGLRDKVMGDNLRFHPSGYLVGMFDESISPWSGATQGYHSSQFLSQGIKLESLWATAPVFAQRFPLAPRQFKRALKRYDKAAVWDTWVSAEDSVGKIRTLPNTNRLDIQYEVGKGDLRRLQEGNALLAELFAAAGAREVMSGIKGLPEIMDAQEAPRLIREAKLQASDLPCGSNHVMGGAVMGADPRKAACDGWGAVHGTAGLYLCDTSIFPTSPGVNPMLTAMALAHRLGAELPGRL
ncbi:MAG: GMC family oxidoreductase N-terminal domain-containing protein, partial [Deltaproteobacteria bacterium]|nr:GMC family oxidoreductase N-terminal domain-containing protein [Deltaproteobacteria bacterium]